MTKMLWHSNAPWSPTGYGQQTALFAPPLAERYDLALSSFYGLEGSPIAWEGIPVLPGISGHYGNEHLVRHAQRFFGGDPKNGIVATLMDVWVLDPQWMSKVNCVSWVPVDHEPAPPQVVQFFIDSGAVPIAMSQFGQEQLGRLDPLYVPHAVNTDVYKPVDKRTARNTAFPPGAFVIGMVAANKGRPSRKGFAPALAAFAKFAERHDNAYLYLHTMINPGLAQGEDIPALLGHLNIPPDKVRIADQYNITFSPYSHEDMALVYSALDVLLNPALGEGFGVPVLEAQACGVPAIVTDFTAMKEVCRAGWHVEHEPFWTGLNSWQAVPKVDSILDALEDCYSLTPTGKKNIAYTARQHALKYALPKVLDEHMLPALRAAEQRFANQKPIRLKPRKPPMLPPGEMAA